MDILNNFLFLLPSALLVAAAVVLLLAVFLPSRQWEHLAMGRKSKYSDPNKKIVLPRFVLMLMLSLIGGIIFMLLGMPPVTAVGTGIVITALITPLIVNQQNKKKQREGRMEALRISEYIAGRMNSQATLLTAMESLMHEHREGGRSIPICADGVEAALRSVNLGQPFDDQLTILATLYEDLPELSGMWKKYSIMSGSSLGAEAMAAQADDLANNIRIIDELRDTLDTELTISTMTRYFMFFLIGGFTLYLILGGGSMGDVLMNTLAGNVIIGFAAFLLFISQIVGDRIEKLPPLWF